MGNDMVDDLITSPANEKIKAVRKLKDRKFRDLTNTAYVEGIRQVVEAIQQNIAIEKLIFTDKFRSSTTDSRINDVINGCKAPKMVVSEEVFKSFSIKENPSGLAAVVRQKWSRISEYHGGFSGVWVCLWEIADPGNLGTILRTMDAVRASGLILVGNCSDPYDPAAIRASMGAVFSKNLVKSNLEELVSVIKSSSIIAIGTSDTASISYREIRYPKNMFLVMGSERQGIPQQLGEVCTQTVRIPMLGVCDSLNLSVATGVILYEILDQQSVSMG